VSGDDRLRITSTEQLTSELFEQFSDDLMRFQAHLFPLDLNHISGLPYNQGRELLGISLSEVHVIWHAFLYSPTSQAKVGDTIGTRYTHFFESQRWIIGQEKLAYPYDPRSENARILGESKRLRINETIENVDFLMHYVHVLRGL